MRGHQPILAMRRRGVAPRMVVLETDADALRCWRDWQFYTPGTASVEIEPDDSLQRLDLRFCIGMLVMVTGTDESRVTAVGKAAHEAQALRVTLGISNPAADFDTLLIDVPGDQTWPI